MIYVVSQAVPAEAPLIADMLLALMDEVAQCAPSHSWQVNPSEATQRCAEMLVWGQYFAWLAWSDDRPVGFIGLSESHALFAGGVMGCVQEFYVVPGARLQGVGTALLDEVKVFAAQRGMHRLEVCTPPVPVFDGSEKFYERHRFEVAGGRKAKLHLSPWVQAPAATDQTMVRRLTP
jgi:GNAT superfamily N-acetyltransferase